jgi:hypothetical protein
MISGVNTAGTATAAPALFLFATEDGTILGWNPAVIPPGFDPAKAGSYAIIAVDRSVGGAVYKGLAISTVDGAPRLYVTNFHAGTVEVYDAAFKQPPNVPADAFVDPRLQRGYRAHAAVQNAVIPAAFSHRLPGSISPVGRGNSAHGCLTMAH